MNHRHIDVYPIITLLLTIPIAVQAEPTFEIPVKSTNSLETRVAFLERRVNDLVAKLTCVSAASTSTEFVFEGCNVNVHNGDGMTDTQNGLGNLIIGYNENGLTAPAPDFRDGSHNLVVGPDHTYSSSGGFVAGRGNDVTGKYSSVSGARVT